jgi:hypothetical protein
MQGITSQKTKLSAPWASQTSHFVHIYRGPTAVAFPENSNLSSFEPLKFLILVSPLKGCDRNFILTLFLLSDFKIISVYLPMIWIHSLSITVLLFRLRVRARDTLKFIFWCVFMVYIFDHVITLRETSHIYRQAGNPWLLGTVLCRTKV